MACSSTAAANQPFSTAAENNDTEEEPEWPSFLVPLTTYCAQYELNELTKEEFIPVFGHVSWLDEPPQVEEPADSDGLSSPQAAQTPREAQEKKSGVPDLRLYIFGGMQVERTPVDPRGGGSRTRPTPPSSSSSTKGRTVLSNLLQVVHLKDGTVELPTTLIAPLPRYRHAVAVQPGASRRVYLYGGAASEVYLSDLWYFNIDDATWYEPVTIGDKPPKCCGHGLAFETEGKSLYLCGGWDQEGNELASMWQLTVQNQTWVKLTATHFVPRRYFTLLSLGQPKQEEGTASTSEGHNQEETPNDDDEDRSSLIVPLSNTLWAGHGTTDASVPQLLKLLPNEERGAAVIYAKHGEGKKCQRRSAWAVRRRLREGREKLAEVRKQQRMAGTGGSKNPPAMAALLQSAPLRSTSLPDTIEELLAVIRDLETELEEIEEEEENRTAFSLHASAKQNHNHSAHYVALGAGPSMVELGGDAGRRVAAMGRAVGRSGVPDFSDQRTVVSSPSTEVDEELKLTLWDTQGQQAPTALSNRYFLPPPPREVDETSSVAAESLQQQESNSYLDSSRRSSVAEQQEAQRPALFLPTVVCQLEGASAHTLANGCSVILGGRRLVDGTINNRIFLVDCDGLVTAMKAQLQQQGQRRSEKLTGPSSNKVTTTDLSSAAGAHPQRTFLGCCLEFCEAKRVESVEELVGVLSPKHPKDTRLTFRRSLYPSALKGKGVQCRQALYRRASELVEEEAKKLKAMAAADYHHQQRAGRKSRTGSPKQPDEDEEDDELAKARWLQHLSRAERVALYEKETEDIDLHTRYDMLMTELRPYGLHKAALISDELLESETVRHTRSRWKKDLTEVSKTHDWFQPARVTAAVEETLHMRRARQSAPDYPGESSRETIRRLFRQEDRALLSSKALDHGSDSAFLRRLAGLIDPHNPADSRSVFRGHPVDSVCRYRDTLERRGELLPPEQKESTTSTRVATAPPEEQQPSGQYVTVLEPESGGESGVVEPPQHETKSSKQKAPASGASVAPPLGARPSRILKRPDASLVSTRSVMNIDTFGARKTLKPKRPLRRASSKSSKARLGLEKRKFT